MVMVRICRIYGKRLQKWAGLRHRMQRQMGTKPQTFAKLAFAKKPQVWQLKGDFSFSPVEPP